MNQNENDEWFWWSNFQSRLIHWLSWYKSRWYLDVSSQRIPKLNHWLSRFKSWRYLDASIQGPPKVDSLTHLIQNSKVFTYGWSSSEAFNNWLSATCAFATVSFKRITRTRAINIILVSIVIRWIHMFKFCINYQYRWYSITVACIRINLLPILYR